jgi:hypothetical protein
VASADRRQRFDSHCARCIVRVIARAIKPRRGHVARSWTGGVPRFYEWLRARTRAMSADAAILKKPATIARRVSVFRGRTREWQHQLPRRQLTAQRYKSVVEVEGRRLVVLGVDQHRENGNF